LASSRPVERQGDRAGLVEGDQQHVRGLRGRGSYQGDLDTEPGTALIDSQGRFRGIDLGHYEHAADLEDRPAAWLEELFGDAPKHPLT
jgi:hypothetical protein